MNSQLPPGYPHGCERALRLADGRTVQLRPIRPDDAGQLAEAIRTADPDTVRRRFVGGAPHITPALPAHLCTVDHRDRFAPVATEPGTGRGVAVARYEAVPVAGGGGVVRWGFRPRCRECR
ncbi:hypothetical protein COUCH_16725 [Couchioplanes caeruleus]|uniref:hypothetical protein n=1 Tax=Couchioplanes caeruleus TaxID=56438 RepID=UPI0020BE74EA|nr:hypothetical protein [Couchioplanes caeruleus]UQU67814.1 hypothetical protein COUCH_16725 [Couchioplanes caeruleus]